MREFSACVLTDRQGEVSRMVETLKTKSDWLCFARIADIACDTL